MNAQTTVMMMALTRRPATSLTQTPTRPTPPSAMQIASQVSPPTHLPQMYPISRLLLQLSAVRNQRPVRVSMPMARSRTLHPLALLVDMLLPTATRGSVVQCNTRTLMLLYAPRSLAAHLAQSAAMSHLLQVVLLHLAIHHMGTTGEGTYSTNTWTLRSDVEYLAL